MRPTVGNGHREALDKRGVSGRKAHLLRFGRDLQLKLPGSVFVAHVQRL